MNMFQWFKDYMNGHPLRWLAWYFILTIGGILMLGIYTVADAATANLSWTHPTTRADNTPIPIAELRETQIDWARCAANNTFPATALGTKAVPAPANTTTVPDLAYGLWCFRARAVDTGGRVSDNSGTAWSQYLAPPNPPVLGVVNIVAYEISMDNWGQVRLGRAVGTVPLETPCGDFMTQKRAAYYHTVPRSEVTLSKPPKSSVLVAQCAPV